MATKKPSPKKPVKKAAKKTPAKKVTKKPVVKRKPAPKKKVVAKKKAPVKKTVKKNPVGRPTSYQDVYAEQAYKLCLLGATDKELAEFFGVAESTLNLWKLKVPEFSESLTRGKLIADAEVADKFYQRACGYSHLDIHVSNYQGYVTLTPITKHYPPDTGAAKSWLCNRQPEKWREKVHQELTGKDGESLDLTVLTEVYIKPEDVRSTK